MDFLYVLESIRFPALDEMMLLITSLGEELLFMALGMFLFWCVDKYEGYYMLCIGFIGTQINQLLKVVFRIDRPWILDPNFKPVEGAIAEATGYSFPSGHTQSAVGSFGAIARWSKKNWLRIVCAVIFVLVAFSRMYLGVHTPLDVGVSFVIALVLVFTLYPLFCKVKENHRVMWVVMAVMVAWSVAQVLFMELYPFPSEASGEELLHGAKTAYKMLGAVMGFAVVFEVDRRYIQFETKAVWWAQIIKLVGGLALVVGVQKLGYLVFGLIPHEGVCRLLAYFCMVLVAGCVWPLTFRWFAKLGKK